MTTTTTKTRAPDRAPLTGIQGGFSLLEVIIAGVILAMIIAMTARILGGANNMLSTSSIASEGEVKAMDLADGIGRHLRNGIASTLLDGAGNPFLDGTSTTNGVQVQVTQDYKGAPVPGETYRYTLVNGESNTADGIDNNRNNYVDEKNLRFQQWPDANTGAQARPDVVFAINIQRVTITRAGNILTIVVNAEKYDATNRMLRALTGRSIVVLRN